MTAAAIYFMLNVPTNHLLERHNRRIGIRDQAPEKPIDPQSGLLAETRDTFPAQYP